MGPQMSPRVLVVDDDDEMRGALCRMLIADGCTVTEAGSGDEAVVRFLSGSFDLITLDHRMPGLTGTELHTLLSQEFGTGKGNGETVLKTLPPIVIITGNANDAELVAGRRGEGILCVLQKPVSFDRLRDVVRDALQKKVTRETQRLTRMRIAPKSQS